MGSIIFKINLIFKFPRLKWDKTYLPYNLLTPQILLSSWIRIKGHRRPWSRQWLELSHFYTLYWMRVGLKISFSWSTKKTLKSWAKFWKIQTWKNWATGLVLLPHSRSSICVWWLWLSSSTLSVAPRSSSIGRFLSSKMAGRQPWTGPLRCLRRLSTCQKLRKRSC